MNPQKNDKTLVFVSLVIMTILILIVIVSMWVGFGQLSGLGANNSTEGKTLIKIVITIGGGIIILLSWLAFNHQKNKDRKA